MKKHLPKGFSLIELMIAVAIVGILGAIAYPMYQEQTRRSNRADGKTKLMEIMQAQEQNYTVSQTYVTNLTLLGYPADPVMSDNNYYSISAAACAGSTISNCVILTAAPSVSQASDGALTLNSRGQKLPANKW